MTQKEQELLKLLAQGYFKRDKSKNVLNYCSDFITNHHQDFEELNSNLGYSLKFFLKDYLGFHFKWQSSMRSFGKNDDFIADQITESELIEEMTNPTSSIKRLLDTANGDVKLVKPFLPFIMISLDTDTRDKEKMEFIHTGRFVFDFDKIGDEETTLKWMNKVWKGTKNVKPYMAFVSPSGNGFKLFCQVDTSNEDFINDFASEERGEMMVKHKIWYEGAWKELAENFPKIADNIDTATKDPQRLTLLPFIADKATHFKYAPKVFSEYSKIVEAEKEQRRIKKEQDIKKHEVEVKALMQKEGITSKREAYHLYQKNRANGFDLELEIDKFKKVITFIIDLSKEDTRVKNWLKKKFSSYEILNKQSWVLYGVFGSMGINELKKLIPLGSNKLDKNHGDYNWANKSDENYDEDKRKELTLASFYKLVFEIGKVKDYVLDNFAITSSQVSNFKLINKAYENYKYNLDLKEEGEKNADLSEFLKKINFHLDAKKNRLPLIKNLEETEPDIKLGPKEYLDKDVMKNLIKVKYADKRIFSLRSQCGTSCAVLEGDL
ncbi:BT4734/BF3469 family protein [Polaribacter sargassicola]|uniref:BT4734/BF3469 family protein n=1 Tax=Polaribacter sargassicola TaxID=2836891 RepID=UPI001F246286|nr:BT4734/BF3469 family protein [Polaribacter sp. DS7-9]